MIWDSRSARKNRSKKALEREEEAEQKKDGQESKRKWKSGSADEELILTSGRRFIACFGSTVWATVHILRGWRDELER